MARQNAQALYLADMVKNLRENIPHGKTICVDSAILHCSSDNRFSWQSHDAKETERKYHVA